MTVWKVRYYLLPDDEGATFERAIEAMPEDILCDMVEHSWADWVLSVQPGEGFALLVALGDQGITLIADGTLHVPDDARQKCLAAIGDLAFIGPEWHRLHGIEFRSAEAMAAFDASFHGNADVGGRTSFA